MSEERDLKNAIITGATSGIGKEVARSLAKVGYHVILACRNTELANKIKDEIIKTNPKSSIEIGPKLDCLKVNGIREFVEDIGERPIALLINNAGVNMKKANFTEEQIGGLVQVNYVAPYLLSRLLVPNLMAGSKPGRIVNVSSSTHRFGRIKLPDFFTSWKEGNYPNTKLALTLFTYEFCNRFSNKGIECCAVDPGGVKTKIFDESSTFQSYMRLIVDLFYATPEDGAKTVVHAATKEFANVSDKKHDDIENFHFFARGGFASSIVTSFDTASVSGYFSKPARHLYMLTVLFYSILDYPVRYITNGFLYGKTREVKSAKRSYDMKVAKTLWDETEKYFAFLKNSQNH